MVVGCAVRGVQGCYSAIPTDGLVDTGPPVMSDVKLPEAGGESGVVLPDGACNSEAGAIPSSTCLAGGSLSCSPSATSCSLGDPKTCGSTDCLPLANNEAPTYNFRMSQLTVATPPVLAGALIQGSIVNAALDLNAPQCGYGPWEAGATEATGAFNWLLSVDRRTNILTTGGGGPVLDPYSTGYCFVQGDFGGNAVAPIHAPITWSGNSFSTTKPADGVLNVPIFTTASTLENPIILPLKGTRLNDVGISPSGNCIGYLNPQWPSSASNLCTETVCSPTGPCCPKWFTNGALAGYMTLKDADEVGVIVTMSSLCVLLAGKSATTQPCSRNGSAPGKYTCCTDADFSMGDYSSPGGTPNDSVWLSATFAASAVKINDSKAYPCGE